MISQILMEYLKFTPAIVTSLFVILGGVLEVFGLYEKLVKFGSAGALAPITNFGSLVVNASYKGILKDYRKNHHCLFNVHEEYRDIFNKWHFNYVETNVIIDTMIFHLEMMNEDHVEKMLYGKNVYDDDYDPRDYNIDKCKRISSIVDQNKNAFMELFNTFFWELWD